MKHLILLLFLCLATYGCWHAVGAQRRLEVKAAVRRHALPITVIVLMLIAALVLMFILNAPHLL